MRSLLFSSYTMAASSAFSMVIRSLIIRVFDKIGLHTFVIDVQDLSYNSLTPGIKQFGDTKFSSF